MWSGPCVVCCYFITLIVSTERIKLIIENKKRLTSPASNSISPLGLEHDCLAPRSCDSVSSDPSPFTLPFIVASHCLLAPGILRCLQMLLITRRQRSGPFTVLTHHTSTPKPLRSHTRSMHTQSSSTSIWHLVFHISQTSYFLPLKRISRRSLV